MQISKLRSQLQSIPNALVDFPPDMSSVDDDPAVIAHQLNIPDSDKADPCGPYADTGVDGGDHMETGGEYEPVLEWGPQIEKKIARLGKAAAGSEQFQSRLAQAGSDALGYYVPFHARGYQWGAMVRASGVAWMATEYFADLPTDMETKFRLGLQAILQHELFHFATEVAVAQTELNQQAAWWRPALDQRNSEKRGYLHLEEKMANAWMLKAFRTALPAYRVMGKQQALKDFVARQPAGYRDALEVKTGGHWQQGLRELMRTYAEDAGVLEQNPQLWSEAYEWPPHFPMAPRINWRNCVIAFVDDSALYGIDPGWLTFFRRIDNVNETASFRKQLRRLSESHQAAWVTL
jgi:hypothetical protein